LALRREVVHEWNRTLKLEAYLDDEPDRSNHIRLSSRKDRFGIPLNRVRFGAATPYQQRTVEHLLDDLPRRLRSFGVRRITFDYVPLGGHHLGTLRMGMDAQAPVTPDLRVRRLDNLFVASGAVFPTYSPAHPTLTISALSLRLGRKLAHSSG
jgi:choline dehydrogenase-like flavoprotein